MEGRGEKRVALERDASASTISSARYNVNYRGDEWGRFVFHARLTSVRVNRRVARAGGDRGGGG